MRFLIGIITGTILTLFIATAMDAPVQKTLEGAARTLTEAWQTLIDSTSDSLFAPSEAAPGERVSALPEQLARAFTEPLPAADDRPDQPFRAAEPAKSLDPPDELPPPPPVKPVIRVAAEPSLPEATMVSELTDGSLLIPADPASGDTTGVWTPFHSQVSARGFAAHLSRALDHDFRVERQGAGTYQVVFDVTSPAERESLLMEIAEITGQ